MQAGVLRRHSLRHAALARPTALWNTRAATTSPNQACRLTTAQLHVNSTSPQIAARGLANARTLAAERRRCRGRRRSGGAGERFELVARVAGGDLPEVDEHDRASSVQLVYRARDSVVAERGPAEESPGPAEAGDSRSLAVVVVGDDHDAVDVSERALALLVGIAGEAAGAVAAPNDAAAKGSERGIVPERSRVPTDGLPASVAEPCAGQQPEVACGHARGAKRRDRAARRDLGGEGFAKRGHGGPLRSVSRSARFDLQLMPAALGSAS